MSVGAVAKALQWPPFRHFRGVVAMTCHGSFIQPLSDPGGDLHLFARVAARLGWSEFQARLDADGIRPAGGSARIYSRAEIGHLLP